MRTLSLAITLFFVLDPFGNLPVVLSLLSKVEANRRKRVVLRELLFALGALVTAYAAGPWFLGMLELGPADLRICGGVLLGIIALRLVFPDERTASMRDSEGEPFIVPLAIPLMVGPSALATVMIISAQSAAHPVTGLGMILIAWLATASILFLGVLAESFIPQRLLAALERLTGLLLAVMAVHMVMTGIQDYLVNLPKH